MNVKIESHPTNNTIDRKMEKLDEWKVPKSTIKEVRVFIDKARIGQVNEGKKLSESTLSKYLSLLRFNLEAINKTTSKIIKADIEKYEKKLSDRNIRTAGDYRINLQIFLRWKLGKAKQEQLSGWLDTKRKRKTPEYLKESEINKLYKGCKSPKERFLIAVLFDSGARIEEFMNIRYEDIELPTKDQNFVKIALKEEYSKTNGRVISLYWKNSLEAVSEFIKEREHLGINSSDAVYESTYDAIRMFLARLGKRTLDKKIQPHLFRHSSATYYASSLNRHELCYRYGWAFSSDMPDIYISRAGMQNKDLDDKFEHTELQELQTKLSKEEFERKRLQEKLEELEMKSQQHRDRVADFISQITAGDESEVTAWIEQRKKLEASQAEHLVEASSQAQGKA